MPARVARMLVLVTATAGLASCRADTASELLDGQACNFDTAVVWSNMASGQSVVELLRGGRETGTLDIDALGILAGRSLPFRKVGDAAYFLAQGGEVTSHPKLIRLNLTSCQVSVADIAPSLVLGFDVGPDRFYTSATHGLQGQIRSWSMTGKEERAVNIPGMVMGPLNLSGTRLYGVMSAISGGTSYLVELDSTTLHILSKIPLGNIGPPGTIEVGPTDIYIPVYATVDPSNAAQTPASTLLVVSRDTGKVRDITLDDTLPYLVRRDGDRLWIAHTFTDPTLDPRSPRRDLSILDVKTDRFTVRQVNYPILQFELTPSTVVTLGVSGDDHWHLTAYSKKTGSLDFDVELKPPRGQVYIAGVIPRTASP